MVLETTRLEEARKSTAPRGAPGEVRAKILKLVHEHPAMTKSELARATGLAWGTVCYHVDVLRANGLMSAVESEKFVYLLLPTHDAEKVAAYRALRDPDAVAIARHVAGMPQCTMKELTTDLPLSRKVVRNRGATLLAAGILEDFGSGRPRLRCAMPAAVFA